ncbi:MAG: hypothetical protein HWD85_01550 [Flavobacteriaceae bacterium]|nr:hypothetical protein [Flavobacteriaceae bacterium]
MRLKKYILLLAIVPLIAFSAHKYYLSLTQIEYNVKNKSVEIIINVFIDDLDTTLTKAHNKPFKLNSKREIKNVDNYFFDYLKKHVVFKIDGKAVNYKFIGKEYDTDVVFFYLEIENIKSIQEIEVVNTLLIKDFPDQKNLIKAKVNNKHKSALLTKKEQVAHFTYK